MTTVVGEVERLLRIGEAAEQVGVSCRTLRYYEELGLLAPSGRSAGGARRYTDDDVARLLRIRELQELLGFDLGEIGEILQGEDRLADIRHEWSQASPARRRVMLDDAIEVNDRLRALVRAKQDRLSGMMAELDEKAGRYRRRAAELDRGGDGGSVSPPPRRRRVSPGTGAPRS